MSTDSNPLYLIKTFSQLVKYLRDELDWPIESDDFEELTFDYAPEELGLDAATAVKIKEIKQLRPLTSKQPWGIFFVNFAPKQLPVVALRRILSTLVIKKRQSANRSQQAAWRLHDLLFISSYGETEHRDITFAHFAEEQGSGDLPTLRLLGWDDEDTKLKLDFVEHELKDKLRWPDDENNITAWSAKWSAAFRLRPREVIKTAQQLAIRLADLAHGIRKRANGVLAVESARGPLRKMHTAFQEALIHDLSTDDFADMYAQTISYGLLTARISRPAGLVADNLADMVPVTNPFLKEMLETFLTIGGRKGKIDFDELGINDVVQLLRDADMEAVLRDFGDRNPQEDPVIHFYQDFLQEYDAKKRMQRGVFYTPLPVVSYIVRSVHELLQKEFGLQNGLADTTTWGEMAARNKNLVIPKGVSPDDPFVQILDPATGTGTFLVEVIDVIHKTMEGRWQKQGHMALEFQNLWNEYVPKHLLPRLHGYELLMAPYAIAHMKIGLKLHETGYRFVSTERARVYLTNTLEPATDAGAQRKFEEWAPALAHESQAVNTVKRERHFTVAIGNPPYAKHSSNHGEWLNGLLRGKDSVSGQDTENYFQVDGAPLGERNPKWLNDDYVKFMRFCQWEIEKTGCGTFAFITNHGYLDNPTFRGMRQSLIQSFSSMYLLDLHGNAKKKETAPNGGQDENVFDIQQGVSIGIFVARSGLNTAEGSSPSAVYYADLYGVRERKYKRLSGEGTNETSWTPLTPKSPRYLFRPQDDELAPEYERGSLVQDIFPCNAVGFQTHRDYFVIDVSRDALFKRIKDFADPAQSDNTMRARYFSRMPPSKYPVGDTRDWSLAKSRKDLFRLSNLGDWITKCIRQPFDFQWYFHHPSAIDYGRPQVMDNLINHDNVALLWTRPMSPNYEFSVFAANVAVDQSVVGNKSAGAGGTYVAALYEYADDKPTLFARSPGARSHDSRRANLAPALIDALKESLGLASIPDGFGDLRATLGPDDIFRYMYAVFHSPTYRGRYAQFLKRDFPRLPLTGKLKLFRSLVHIGSELVDLHLLRSSKLERPLSHYVGQAHGEVEKASYANSSVWIDKAQTHGFSPIPQQVWSFQIGGYQVCEKWLKDRKGRKLSKDDIAHYNKIVVALSETIRLMKKIDEVIDKHGGWPNAFASAQQSTN